MMHADFRDNLIRMSLLKEGEQSIIDKEMAASKLKEKGFKEITEDEIQKEFKHLVREKYLNELGGRRYELTKSGKGELEEVKEIIKNF